MYFLIFLLNLGFEDILLEARPKETRVFGIYNNRVEPYSSSTALLRSSSSLVGASLSRVPFSFLILLKILWSAYCYYLVVLMWFRFIDFVKEFCNTQPKMQNEEGQITELYIPRKWYAPRFYYIFQLIL